MNWFEQKPGGLQVLRAGATRQQVVAILRLLRRKLAIGNQPSAFRKKLTAKGQMLTAIS
jgi:hypothetical protein